jgi:hypothetical protein
VEIERNLTDEIWALLGLENVEDLLAARKEDVAELIGANGFAAFENHYYTRAPSEPLRESEIPEWQGDPDASQEAVHTLIASTLSVLRERVEVLLDLERAKATDAADKEIYPDPRL